MSHYKDLMFYNRALDAGAIDGYQALEALLGLKQEHQAARAERQAATQEGHSAALDALIGAATTGAQEGTPMAQLKPILDSIMAQAGMPSMPYGKIPAIDPLYQGGQSTVSGGLDPESMGELVNLATNRSVNGKSEAEALKDAIDRLKANAPDNWKMYLPEVQEVINRIYS